MDFLLLILPGIGMAYLGLYLWDSNIRFRLFGLIPIPRFLVAGALILMGVGMTISGCQIIPDDFLGGSMQKVAQIFRFDSDGNDGIQESSQPTEHQYDYVENTFSYVSGSWGEKFVRSNGYTYPFVFDNPVRQCMGFTLDYEIVAIEEGNLNGNFRYEVYARQTNGKWKSVKLFQMNGNKLSVDIRFDNAMDIDAVAVVCGKKGDASFSYTIGIRDVRYS